MNYYRITLSSKIATIKDGLVKGGEDSPGCSKSIIGISIPNTLSSISNMAVYECQNIKSISVGDTTYVRPKGVNEIAIKVANKTVVEKIVEKIDTGCTVLPFELDTPLCPEDMSDN